MAISLNSGGLTLGNVVFSTSSCTFTRDTFPVGHIFFADNVDGSSAINIKFMASSPAMILLTMNQGSYGGSPYWSAWRTSTTDNMNFAVQKGADMLVIRLQ